VCVFRRNRRCDKIADLSAGCPRGVDQVGHSLRANRFGMGKRLVGALTRILSLDLVFVRVDAGIRGLCPTEHGDDRTGLAVVPGVY
jgi:hypothetical protein